MLGLVKRLLMAAGVYERLKYSTAYEPYLQLFRRDLIAARADEVALYRAILAPFPRRGLIFDVGANEGNKTEVFLRLGAKVVCVEPDRSNAWRLRRRFAGRCVTIVEQAASDTVGTACLHVVTESSALNTLSAKWVRTIADPQKSRFGVAIESTDSYDVETTTLDRLVARFGRPDFVKIDVEGYEINVLHGLSTPVAFVSFELNLPEFRSEGLGCVARLHSTHPHVEFNCVLAQGLELEGWLGAMDFSAWLESTPLRYMEVFARTPS